MEENQVIGGGSVEVVARIHDVAETATTQADWEHLVADLAYWASGHSYADVDSVTAALATVHAEMTDTVEAIGATQVLTTATAMLGAWASAMLRDESAVVVDAEQLSVVERVRAELDGGSRRPSELVELVGADRFQVSKAIARLVANDEVELEPGEQAESDKRSRRYRLKAKRSTPHSGLFGEWDDEERHGVRHKVGTYGHQDRFPRLLRYTSDAHALPSGRSMAATAGWSGAPLFGHVAPANLYDSDTVFMFVRSYTCELLLSSYLNVPTRSPAKALDRVSEVTT